MSLAVHLETEPSGRSRPDLAGSVNPDAVNPDAVNPDAVAVRHNGSAVTYGQLAGRSDALAAALARLGLPAGSAVGLRVSPLNLPVALLGAAKAGHFGVPLDPDGPRPAVTFGAILTDGDLETSAGPGRTELATPRPGPLAGAVATPEGHVLLAQAPLVRLLHASGERLGVGHGWRVLVTEPLTTAPGLLDLLLGLARGAEVRLDGPSVIAAEIAAEIAAAAAEGVPVLLHASTGTWEALLAAAPRNAPTVVAVCDDGTLAPRLATVAGTVWLATGTAESGGYGRLDRPDDPAAGRPAVLLPAGPADGGPTAALDDDGLAVGLLGRPASETAARWRPDPRPAHPGARVRDTGIQVWSGPDPEGVRGGPDPQGPTGDGRELTRQERTVAGIWVELLGVAEPPADASFFEVGGYSLSITRLAYLLERAFGLPVPVADLFVHTTVAAQAALVEELYQRELAELADLPPS